MQIAVYIGVQRLVQQLLIVLAIYYSFLSQAIQCCLRSSPYKISIIIPLIRHNKVIPLRKSAR